MNTVRISLLLRLGNARTVHSRLQNFASIAKNSTAAETARRKIGRGTKSNANLYRKYKGTMITD